MKNKILVRKIRGFDSWGIFKGKKLLTEETSRDKAEGAKEFYETYDFKTDKSLKERIKEKAKMQFKPLSMNDLMRM